MSHGRVLAAIPSPSTGVWQIGPFPLRAYAVCIIAGVIAATVIGNRRFVARGGKDGAVADIATYAVPAGLVGARLYHVITSPQPYFGAGGSPVAALYIWRGGLGIWGGVAAGVVVGAWLARRRGYGAALMADALAPGMAVGQAIGRVGNYFNQELYGGPTHLPWAVHITRTDDGRVPGYYHPTFLYEALWDLGVAAVVVWADRRWRLSHGRAMALYVALYTVGRAWVEALRIDPANHLFGVRLNDWTSLVVFLAAVAYLIATRRLPALPEPTSAPGRGPATGGPDPRTEDIAAGQRTEVTGTEGSTPNPVALTGEGDTIRERPPASAASKP